MKEVTPLFQCNNNLISSLYFSTYFTLSAVLLWKICHSSYQFLHGSMYIGFRRLPNTQMFWIYYYLWMQFELPVPHNWYRQGYVFIKQTHVFFFLLINRCLILISMLTNYTFRSFKISLHILEQFKNYDVLKK